MQNLLSVSLSELNVNICYSGQPGVYRTFLTSKITKVAQWMVFYKGRVLLRESLLLSETSETKVWKAALDI